KYERIWRCGAIAACRFTSYARKLDFRSRRADYGGEVGPRVVPKNQGWLTNSLTGSRHKRRRGARVMASVFLLCAIGGGTVMVLQLAMAIFGIGGHHADGSGYGDAPGDLGGHIADLGGHTQAMSEGDFSCHQIG